MFCGRRPSLRLILVLAALLFGGALPAVAADESPPPILQWFEVLVSHS